MKKEKTRISAAVEQKLLLGSFLFLFLTGLILSMFLPLGQSWLAGLFFILSAVSLGYDIWLMRVRGVGTFDRQLSRGFRSQFLFLLGIVAFIFLLGAGLLLLFRHEYDDSYNCSIDTAYDALLLFAHRYLGYNYYSDEDHMYLLSGTHGRWNVDYNPVQYCPAKEGGYRTGECPV